MKYINPLQRAALKIKAKHLAAEARIIHAEEVQWSGPDKLYFKHHRKWDVRNEARATQLTIAMLRGVPYHVIEHKCYDLHKRDYHITKRMASMALKYGNQEFQSLIPEPSQDLYKQKTQKWGDWRERNRIRSEFRQAELRKIIQEWFNGNQP